MIEIQVNVREVSGPTSAMMKMVAPAPFPLGDFTIRADNVDAAVNRVFNVLSAGLLWEVNTQEPCATCSGAGCAECDEPKRHVKRSDPSWNHSPTDGWKDDASGWKPRAESDEYTIAAPDLTEEPNPEQSGGGGLSVLAMLNEMKDRARKTNSAISIEFAVDLSRLLRQYRNSEVLSM